MLTRKPFRSNRISAFGLVTLLCTIPYFNPLALAANYSAEVSRKLAEGGQLYDSGQYSSAKACFNEALQLEPRCPDAYNGLGLALAKEGDRFASNQCYMNAIKLNPDYYNALYNLANNLYLDKNYSESLAYYLRTLKVREKEGKEPDPDLFASLANVYRDRAALLTGLPKQQDMARALDFYARSLKLKPKNPQVHAMLGELYFDQGQYSAAEKELRTAISLNPQYAYAFFVLGRVYKEKREFPSALLAFYNSMKNEKVADYRQDTERRILSMGIPKSLLEHFAQGFEALTAGNNELAQTEFQVCTEMQTAMKAIALNNYGFSLARAGALAAAIDSYRAGIKVSPHGIPELYYNLGMAYFQSKRPAEAEDAIKQCLKEAKGAHYLAHNALGMLYAGRGKLNQAINEYNLALMQSGDGLAVVAFNRALLLEKLGLKKEAMASYGKYLLAAPSGLNAVFAREWLAKLKG